MLAYDSMSSIKSVYREITSFEKFLLLIGIRVAAILLKHGFTIEPNGFSLKQIISSISTIHLQFSITRKSLRFNRFIFQKVA